jgi:PEGA domain
MRSSSSRRSAVAAALCAVLSVQWTLPALSFGAEPTAAEPALLLKYAAPELPEAESREILAPLPGILGEAMRVRWVAAPREDAPEPGASARFPEPDDAALRSISAKLSGASAHMERVEAEAAGALLEQAEKESRAYRITDVTRPFLAEIFFREAVLRLWAGDSHGAETLLARSQALRPDFVPDPALFPPQLLAAWERARIRPVPEADLLIESLPSGATITVDGRPAGTTPARVRPGTAGPSRIRVSRPGYKDAERVGQWLPGDAETVALTLSGDRVARLGERLAAPGGTPGEGAGALIAEFARASGVRRVAIVTLDKGDVTGRYRARVFSGDLSGRDPAFLGQTEVSGGASGAHAYGEWAAKRLLAGGWPPETKDPEGKPWYKSWWVWGIVISGAVIAAAALGGGGSGGTSGGSVAVNF